MSDEKYNKEICVKLLRDKHERLCKSGEDRYPKRSDFEEQEVVAIKAHLGPWPRALEAAGIKETRNDDRKERNREKRIAAKRARISALKNKTNNNDI